MATHKRRLLDGPIPDRAFLPKATRSDAPEPPAARAHGTSSADKSMEETSQGNGGKLEASQAAAESGVAVTEAEEEETAVAEAEEEETAVAGSEETEEHIRRILQSIDHFTYQVSELLEAGRALFRDVAADFEERLFSIHKERVERWEEEIRELRAHDAANVQAGALLHNAQLHLLHTVHD